MNIFRFRKLVILNKVKDLKALEILRLRLRMTPVIKRISETAH